MCYCKSYFPIETNIIPNQYTNTIIRNIPLLLISHHISKVLGRRLNKWWNFQIKSETIFGIHVCDAKIVERILMYYSLTYIGAETYKFMSSFQFKAT